jgi:anti-anti-sigma regulatory factor
MSLSSILPRSDLAFLGITRTTGDTTTRLDLAGELHGPDTVTLQATIFEVIIEGSPDELTIDLDRVALLGADGHRALVPGYIVAVEFGTAYHVVNAHAPVLDTLQSQHTYDMLTDSRDLGALQSALLSRPTPAPA